LVSPLLCYYNLLGHTYSPLLLITKKTMRWCLSIFFFFFFFFLQWANLIGRGHHFPKKKLWGLPKIEGSILKYRVPPLWPTYIGERRITFVKENGIKVRCYWECHWGTHWKLGEPNHEHIGPIIVNIWQMIGNMMGTQE
jgi:hypothetical protein